MCDFISLIIAKRQLSLEKSGSITSILVANYRFHGYLFGICNVIFSEFFVSLFKKVEALPILLRGLRFRE